jgi:hypothetical protein
LAKECLKNLVGEDFLYFADRDHLVFETYEQKYNNIQGNALENDLARIVLRYQTEAKTEA